jgi:hypothetical protein
MRRIPGRRAAASPPDSETGLRTIVILTKYDGGQQA